MQEFKKEIERGRALHRQGKLKEAMAIYREVIGQIPAHPEARHLYGVALLQSGDHQRAEEELRQAIAEKKDDPNYFNNLASAVAAGERPEEALDILETALSLDRAHVPSLSGKGSLLLSLGNLKDAETVYRSLVEIEPENLLALNNLAIILARTNRPEEAVELFQRCAEGPNAMAEVFSNLARTLEILNKSEESRAACEEALKRDPDLVDAKLVKCRLLRRDEKFEEARAVYEDVLAKPLPDGERASAFYHFGQVLDRLGDAEAAYDAFAKGNELTSTLPGFDACDPERYLDRVRRNRRWFDREKITRLALDPEPAIAPPVFFVGFPRSGTTLMEQTLAAHPSIVTTSERSPLEHMRQLVVERTGKSGPFPDLLDTWTPRDLSEIRDAFWVDAKQRLELKPDLIMVDKTPLNIGELGFANILFPTGKAIVALHDPRDVCLSCFMQNFGASDAMSNFLTYQQSARAYNEVMELWLHYRDSLTMPVFEYRYEELVQEFSEIIGGILEFLGLPWTEEIEWYREKAQDRFIPTPSYRDVTSELYTRACGRWSRYEQSIGDSLADLSAIAGRLGYES